jgi:hypothetical protein
VIVTGAALWHVQRSSPRGGVPAYVGKNVHTCPRIEVRQHSCSNFTMETKSLANQITRIEELLRDLEGGSDTPNGYMREHLEAARFYLLGSMPQEYRLNLELAGQLLPEIDDRNLRGRIAAFLDDQQT